MPEYLKVLENIAVKIVLGPLPPDALVMTLHLNILWLILPEMWRWRRALSENLGVKSRGRPQ